MICRELFYASSLGTGNEMAWMRPSLYGESAMVPEGIDFAQTNQRTRRWVNSCVFMIYSFELLIWLEKGSCEFEHKLPVKTARGAHLEGPYSAA